MTSCRAAAPLSIPQARALEENRNGAADLASGALHDAEQWFFSALARSQRIDDGPGQAVALLNLARVDAERWDFDRAAERAERALSLGGLRPDLMGAAMATLAAVESQRGRHAIAIDSARQANALAAQTGRPRRAAAGLRGDRSTTVAYALIRAGGKHCSEARGLLERAPEVYRRAFSPAADAALAHLRGQLALGEADLATASGAFARALAIDQMRGAAADIAADLEALATVAEGAGDLDEARRWLRRALWTREVMDNPRRTLAVADRLAALGEATATLQATRVLHRAEVIDQHNAPPARARPCN